MIAKEGRLVTALTAVGALVAQAVVGTFAALPLWLLLFLLALAYRESPRPVPPLPLAIVSPVDGRVVAVGQESDPWLERQALRIVIRVRIPSIAPLRSPTEAKVMDYRRGPAGLGGIPRPCHAVWLQTDEGEDVVVLVETVRGLASVRCYANAGERLGQGQRAGFLHFCPRVHVYLPSNARADVKSGQRTRAGSGILATLIHD